MVRLWFCWFLLLVFDFVPGVSLEFDVSSADDSTRSVRMVDSSSPGDTFTFVDTRPPRFGFFFLSLVSLSVLGVVGPRGSLPSSFPTTGTSEISDIE